MTVFDLVVSILDGGKGTVIVMVCFVLEVVVMVIMAVNIGRYFVLISPRHMVVSWLRRWYLQVSCRIWMW
jgi:hypothetical protein